MSRSKPQIDALREQIQNAAKNKNPLSIAGEGTKSWDDNQNTYTKEELVITACADTPLKEIKATLREKNQVLAFKPPHFGENVTFGGAIVADLTDPGRITVGNFRDFVLGARILHPGWAKSRSILWRQGNEERNGL